MGWLVETGLGREGMLGGGKRKNTLLKVSMYNPEFMMMMMMISSFQ